MARYKLSHKAEDDIREIYTFISKDNEGAAREVLRNIKSTCEMVSEMPMLGRSVSGLDVPGVRIMLVRKFYNYIIVYINTSEVLLIIRVLNAKRDIPTILSNEFS